MKKHLLKTMLTALVLLLGGGNGAWGAGYTRTLTDALSVAGYKAKQLYDFQNNSPEVLPTSGDLRYRAYENGVYWGLHNFGGGTRSGDASIPVAKGNILVLQLYSSSYVPTINKGTQNANLTSATSPYYVYDITEDAEAINFSVPRYGGIVAALVMEKDEDAATADYTITYLSGTETIKETTGNAVVGGSVVSDTSFFEGGVKYFRVDDEPESFTIEASGNNFTVNVRQAATYSYTLLSSLGETIAPGSAYEGETVSVGYPRYQLKDGAFYEAGVTNKEYRLPIALTADNVTGNVTYSEKSVEGEVVFYAEGENIEGMTKSTAGNIAIRASNALAGVASSDVVITTLPAGKYVLHVGTFTSKTSSQTIYIGYGETQLAFASSSNLNETASEEIVLTESTELKYFGTTSSADAQFDYIWIQKTGDVAPEFTLTIKDYPKSVVADSDFDVTVTVKNTGSVDLTDLNVWAKVNNNEWSGTTKKVTLAAGQETDVTLTVGEISVEDDSFTLSAAANLYGGAITTSDPVTISYTEAQNLEVTAVSVPAEVTAGTTAEVTVTIQNNADWEYTDLTVNLYESSKGLVGTKTGVSLPLGEATPVTVTLDASALTASDVPYKLSVQVVVDEDEEYWTDEDNPYTFTVVEAEAPEFSISDYLINAEFNPSADKKGWTEDVSGSFRDLGMYAIGGSANVRFAAPTADDTHLSTEFAAGFEARWSGNYAAYTQTVSELPAGAYTLTYDVENVNGKTTSVNYENRFKVTVGDKVYADASTEWMKGKSAWTTHTVDFVLLQAGPVTFSFGYGTGSNNTPADNTPAIYVSHLNLTRSPLADADDYAALGTAVSTAEEKLGALTLGFDADEYAPYNLLEVKAALAAAKAVDQEAGNKQAAVQDLTEALTTATWVANTDEVNAIWDPAFSNDYGTVGNVKPTAWTGTGSHDNATDVRWMWNSDSYAGLKRASSGKALFTKFGAEYGRLEGYTLPLNAEEYYTLSFIYGGWDDCKKDGYVTIADPNDAAVSLLQSADLPLDAVDGHQKTGSWKEYQTIFKTADAGDYVLGLRKKDETKQSQYVYSDFSLKKTTEAEAAAYYQTVLDEVKADYDEGANDSAEKTAFKEAIEAGTDGKTVAEIMEAAASLPTLRDAFVAATAQLVEEANTLAADDDAVAVGKLRDAISAYNDGGELVDLLAAVNQFKADNADQEKDETAKVATNGWKKFTGNDAADVCATQFAPAITTYDGRTAQLAEVYEETAATTGQIIYQNITGLTNGSYKVGFYGNAFFTDGRGFDSDMADGAEDVAYVFANDEKAFITAHIATATTENNFRQFDVEVTDGTIKLGMGKEKAGTNWHTMQIYQLTWFTTAKAVYAADKENMTDLVSKAEALAGDVYKTNGKDDLNNAIEAAKAALESNKLNIGEFEAEIQALQAAIDAFKAANTVTFDGIYYVQSVTTGKFMAAGHNYGTRGIVNAEGLDLTLAAADGKVTFDSKVSNGGNNHFLGSNLYMDSAASGWTIEQVGDDEYTIGNGTQYIGVDADDNLVLVNEAASWKFTTADAITTERVEALSAATADNGLDATFLLKNPNFNRNDQRVDSWTVSSNCTNKNLNGGNQTNNCAESYHSLFTISQAVAGAPAGVYQLTAQGFYRQDDNADEPVPVFFANDKTGEVPAKTGSEGSMSNASVSFANGLYTIEPIEFIVGKDGQLTVGIKNETALHQWVIFDNFRLTYYGPAPETTVTLAVTDAQYATFVAPFDVEIPEGVTAYTVDGVGTDNELTMTALTGTIGANTPVVLYSETAVEKEVSGVAEAAEAPTAGLLTGVYTDTPAVAGTYILQKQDAVAFFKVETDGVTTVKANHAYLKAATAARALYFGGEATAIGALKALTSGDAEVYDVNGRRLSSLVKGVNIVRTKDGRTQKVMVK